MERGFHQPATLITRPRGFGKTLTLSMVKTFFEKTDEDTSVYFKDLAIWSCGEKYTSEQGKYPVIYVDLTDLDCKTYKEMEKRFAEKMPAEFLRHPELSEEGAISKYWIKEYKEVVDKKTKIPERSLELLTRLLHDCDKVKPEILVDGFEVPLIAGLRHGYYKDAFYFFESIFSSSMKDNRDEGAGLILGEFYTVLAGMFSGFNNVLSDTLIFFDYVEGFGFTEEDVKGLLKRHGVEDKYDEVKEWYGGYFMENRNRKFIELFNPDSVIRYLKNGCRAEPYRDEFYETSVMRNLFADGDDYVIKNTERFLEGEIVSCRINDDSRFGTIIDGHIDYFQFLFMSGYLSRAEKADSEYTRSYEVRIPNKEIMEIFAKHAKALRYGDGSPHE